MGTFQSLKSSNFHEFKAVISHTNPGFLQKVYDISEINGLQISKDHEYPCIIVQTAHAMKVIPFFEDLCYREGINILDLIKREGEIPDFSPTIKCERITKSQAAHELLRRFLGGHKTVLLNSENGQGSTRLLFELTSLLGNAECYQITLGPIKEMVDVLYRVCKETHSQFSTM